MFLDGTIESKKYDFGDQTMSKRQRELIWAVVKVESGIPVTVKAYRNMKAAEMREKFWRKNMHQENDEIGIFEIPIMNLTPRAISI